MEKIDKIKSLVGFVLVAIVILSFAILGKDHDVTRWLAASSIIIWMAGMITINRIKKKNQNPEK